MLRRSGYERNPLKPIAPQDPKTAAAATTTAAAAA